MNTTNPTGRPGSTFSRQEEVNTLIEAVNRATAALSTHRDAIQMLIAMVETQNFKEGFAELKTFVDNVMNPSVMAFRELQEVLKDRYSHSNLADSQAEVKPEEKEDVFTKNLHLKHEEVKKQEEAFEEPVAKTRIETHTNLPDF